MALHRILVVDDSLAVRETISILLGADYEVHTSTIESYAATGISAPAPDLIVAARGVGAHRGQPPFPPGVPVLWIDGPSGAGAGAHAGPALPKHFSPRELRRRVGELLAGPLQHRSGTIGPAARLRPPYVTAQVACILAEALDTDLPLHLVGEAGTGKRSIARAIHAVRGSGPFLPLPAQQFDPAILTTPGGIAAGAIFLDRVEQLDPAGQQALLAGLEPTGLLRSADGRSLRVFTSASCDLDAAAEAGTFAPDLYYRLTGLTARIAPLRERPEDIPDLAQMLAADLAALLGRQSMTFSDRALARLANYLWFGNLAELETVLARTLALCRHPLVDAEDLLFDGARLPAAPPSPAPAAPNRPPVFGGQPLDLIINELAHEFKNPLVTIKTFAHHLRQSLPSGGDEEQVARLTGEAVAQIDQTLENLLEFTRLEDPVLQSVRLSTVLDPVFDECGRALAARGLALDHPTVPPTVVRGDPQQLAYALANLVHALTRDLAAGAHLVLRFTEPAVLIFELPRGADPLGSHLATLLDRPDGESPALPLGIAIASAVLERNGARLTLTPADGPPRLCVHFTPADELLAAETGTGNGTAPRPSR